MNVRLGFAVTSLVAAAVACGDASHVFEGRAYAEGRGCLFDTSSVDVVEGERPGNCSPICLADGHQDGGRTLYVSAMCGPYPIDFDASGNDPACAPALAAFGRGDRCNADGTSTRPIQDAASD